MPISGNSPKKTVKKVRFSTGYKSRSKKTANGTVNKRKSSRAGVANASTLDIWKRNWEAINMRSVRKFADRNCIRLTL